MILLGGGALEGGTRFRKFSALPGQWLPRGIALFLGGFALINALAGFRAAELDANLWWIDLRFLPEPLLRGLLLVAAALIFACGVRRPQTSWRRWLTLACLASLGLGTILNCAQYYYLLAQGRLATGMPVPLSAFAAAALCCVGRFVARTSPEPQTRGGLVWIAATAAVCGFAFPLLQMLCFGKTDYRRPADAAVVFGARVYADGRLSDALADRVRTGCQLYHQGLARKLIFSGGPGDGAVHETEAMKRMAVGLGVNAQDILVDPAGLNTLATVRNTEPLFRQLQASRVLVVSHFYHLPRIKLTYQRDGWEVYTVPARESYLLRQLPYNMIREVAALWVYYLRPLAGGVPHG